MKKNIAGIPRECSGEVLQIPVRISGFTCGKISSSGEIGKDPAGTSGGGRNVQ